MIHADLYAELTHPVDGTDLIVKVTVRGLFSRAFDKKGVELVLDQDAVKQLQEDLSALDQDDFFIESEIGWE